MHSEIRPLSGSRPIPQVRSGREADYVQTLLDDMPDIAIEKMANADYTQTLEGRIEMLKHLVSKHGGELVELDRLP